jgi:hypothetical protein
MSSMAYPPRSETLYFPVLLGVPVGQTKTEVEKIVSSFVL